MTAEEQKSLREISKELSARDRAAKSALIVRRRNSLLTQLAMDKALGLPSGSTKELEAYDSDPTLSELRRYEALIILAERGPESLAELLSEQEIDGLIVGLCSQTILGPERRRQIRALIAATRPEALARLSEEQQ